MMMEQRIAEIRHEMASGPTNGPVLVRGRECSGWWAQAEATTEDGETVVVEAEHLYDSTGRLVDQSAVVAGVTAEGNAVERWMADLHREHIAHGVVN